MSEMVPEGWTLRSIASGIDILSGFPFKSEHFSTEPSHTGLIRIRDLVNQELETFYGGEFEDQFLVTKGDILIGMDGDFTIVKWKSEDALLNQRICKIDVSENSDLHLDYLFHDLKDELLRIHEKTGSTTVKHLSVKDIRGIEKAFPPLPEQKKIASILTSVDEVIEKTQSQIDKLQDLKKGTMNELLTKGIGHTEFKDSELGRIPKSWEVKRLGEVGRFSKGKGISKKDIVTRGVPCIRYAEIYTEYDFVIKKFKSFIHPNERSNSKKIQKNDIIFAGSGETVEDIGKSVAFVSDIEAFVGGDAILLSPSNEIDSVFLSYQLNDGIRRMQLRKLGQGSSVIHIYSSGLEEIVVSLPPIFEQTKIASIISSVEEKIEQLESKLQQTQSLKKSLMQDLLTGKVRVSVN